MNFSHRIFPWCLTLYLSIVAGAAQAQTTQELVEPTFGQPGKDVVWVPTPPALVEKMLDMAQVTPQDYVIDLGSGDGRNVIAAAKRGARALGVEFNPDLVELSKYAAAAETKCPAAAGSRCCAMVSGSARKNCRLRGLLSQRSHCARCY